MEDKRFHVSITNIENDLNALHREIQDVPIKLFFHLGVLGTAEFDDSRQQIAIVPINYPYATGPYYISRAENPINYPYATAFNLFDMHKFRWDFRLCLTAKNIWIMFNEVFVSIKIRI